MLLLSWLFPSAYDVIFSFFIKLSGLIQFAAFLLTWLYKFLYSLYFVSDGCPCRYFIFSLYILSNRADDFKIKVAMTLINHFHIYVRVDFVLLVTNSRCNPDYRNFLELTLYHELKLLAAMAIIVSVQGCVNNLITLTLWVNKTYKHLYQIIDF